MTNVSEIIRGMNLAAENSDDSDQEGISSSFSNISTHLDDNKKAIPSNEERNKSLIEAFQAWVKATRGKMGTDTRNNISEWLDKSIAATKEALAKKALAKKVLKPAADKAPALTAETKPAGPEDKTVPAAKEAPVAVAAPALITQTKATDKKE